MKPLLKVLIPFLPFTCIFTFLWFVTPLTKYATADKIPAPKNAVLLDNEAEAVFDDNIKQLREWVNIAPLTTHRVYKITGSTSWKSIYRHYQKTFLFSRLDQKDFNRTFNHPIAEWQHTGILNGNRVAVAFIEKDGTQYVLIAVSVNV